MTDARMATGTTALITPESFIELFRARHGWKCRPGSAIAKDLTDFATEQAGSAHSADDLYILFCVTNGITPKLTGIQG